MGIIDYSLMIFILSGAGYLFYRTYIKKGGPCSSCHARSTCQIKNRKDLRTCKSPIEILSIKGESED